MIKGTAMRILRQKHAGVRVDRGATGLRARPGLGIVVTLVFALAACAKKQPPPPRPPPTVKVTTLTPQAVSLTTDLPGRTVAFKIADIRPQVSGVIQKRMFVEGSDVQARAAALPDRSGACTRPPTRARRRAPSRRGCRQSATSRWQRSTPSASRTTTTPSQPLRRAKPRRIPRAST